MTDLQAGRAALRDGDTVRALDLLLPLARAGDAAAQRWAGVAYLDSMSDNPCRSVSEGLYWLRAAAEQDDAPAAYELGSLCKYGDVDLPTDRKSAAGWFKKAQSLSEPKAEAGSAEHQFVLGCMYWSGNGVRRNAKRGLRWLRLAAEQGDIEHQSFLGSALWWASGSDADMEEAVAWTTRVAEQGHVGAQYHLAANYAVGEEIEQDFRKAAKWYRRAAKQGHAEATYNLACMYLEGEGMPPDVPKAIGLLDRAADLGFTDAMGFLGMIHARGLRNRPADAERAARYFLRAIRLGCNRAQRDLAAEIVEGFISADAVAAALLRLAGDDGVVQAEDILATLRQSQEEEPERGP